MCRRIFLVFLLACALTASAQIPRATDSPKPRSPSASAASFHLPPGFRAELVASEPLIREPSGLCWDEHGRLFVSELHGYNVDGFYDIQELNKTGRLDTDIKRVRGTKESKEKAEPETYGVIQRLIDRDGDGVMDDAIVWATNLPPVYGIVPARGGLIAACAPDIVFLADTNSDDIPDQRETLFSGFAVGELERGINAPQWGADNWIYFGAGWGGGKVTGPHLNGAVELGRTDFRIKPDGSAIEPVEGEVGTFGHAMTAGGDRFFTSTSRPARYALPLPWRYLARNPDAIMPRLIQEAQEGIETFPLAPVHPWRLKRASDPRWVKFYGREETKPQGYFTSACSPLLYDDVNWPPEFRGQLFVCDPAQSLIARFRLEDDGPGYKAPRPAGWEKREFFAAEDSWVRPMFLTPAPDGAVWMVDMYREFIEDFSAIPRSILQQYDVLAGRDRGRIWRIAYAPDRDHATAMPEPPGFPDLTALSNAELAKETISRHRWHRDTARRLLIERRAKDAAPALSTFLHNTEVEPAAAVNVLYALEGLDAIESADLLAAWHHASVDVKRQVLRIADQRFSSEAKLIEKRLLDGAWPTHTHPRLLLQIAASLGESKDPRAPAALASLARDHGDVRWMDAAILSSAHERERDIFDALAAQPGKGTNILELLMAAIASRGEVEEIRAAEADVRRLPDLGARQLFVRVLEAGLADALRAKKTEPPPMPAPPAAEWLAEVDKLTPGYVAALAGPRDAARGRELFKENCAACHEAKGLGSPVAPNLDSERLRAEETILRDILLPNETIRPGSETFVVQTRRGDTVPGILASESPTSITLRLPGGDEISFLRKRIARTRTVPVSLMPATLARTLDPRQVADIIEFLRSQEAK